MLVGMKEFDMNASRRFIASLAVCVALLFALVGCASGAQVSENASSSSPEASSPSSSSANVPTAKLAIIHTNDTHGYDQASDTCLGMAAVAQLKADYETEGYDVLLVDAGDALQGNVLVDDSQGAVVPGFMNACGYDAMTLGNHEFDYGADVLQERIDACNFPVLCANITVGATGEPFTQANTMITLSDGTKVGIFGLDTPETMTKSAPKNTAGLTFAQGQDLYDCAQEQIDGLKSQGCDLVVCLGHLGEGNSSAPNRARDVIANTQGLDLFIDGHDHHVENAVVKDQAGSGVLAVETGSYLANIGVVTYENGVLTETLKSAGGYEGANPDVAAQVDAIAADVESRLSERVGYSPFTLNGSVFPGVRDRETTLGDFATDAFRWEAKQALGNEPDAALLNAGAFRSSIEAGDITVRDLHNALPYSNHLCTIEVTGAQLLEALESATQQSPESTGAFPQVSGITFTLDVSVPYEKGEQYPYSTFYKPANPGARVTITDVNGKGFDKNATYLLATTDFVATGGDTYYAFTDAFSKSMETTGYTCFQTLQYYLSDACEGTVPEQYAEPAGRVTVIGRPE